jgi:hypothetical protein
MTSIRLFALAAALLAGSGAEAAHLGNVQGTVLVNHGSGFQPLAAGAELSPGDRVKVVNGAADIVYDHCRTVTVTKGQVVLVVLYTETNGVCTGGYKDAAAIPEPPGFPTELLIAGGVIGGVVGIATSGNKPASP